MSTIKLYPQHYDPDADATCGDCGDTCRAIECGPIRDPSERLCSGDPLPAGECPNCGSLAYVTPFESREDLGDYENRVRALESEGMTRSDAQAVADAELMA